MVLTLTWFSFSPGLVSYSISIYYRVGIEFRKMLFVNKDQKFGIWLLLQMYTLNDIHYTVLTHLLAELN